MAPLNPRLVVDTGTPPIPEAQGWLARYDGALGPPIDLSQAVPGYPPHRVLLDGLAAAAGSPEAARYGDIFGDSVLRQAYAAHVSTFYGATVEAADVAITSGCNQAFFVVALALAAAGDALLVPAPWYFNHQMTLAMLGIEARALPTSAANGFVPDPAEAERRLDERVRAIVLVSPNNPTGAVYPAETIEGFADLARRRGVRLILDETYRDFGAEAGFRPHRLFARSDWRDQVIQLYSFSKAYCIPGHRLGAIVAGAAVLDQVAKVMDCVQICAGRAGQIALAPAIAALGPWREANRIEIGRRVAAARAAFGALDGWALDSIGAYFAYLGHPFAGLASATVAERLAVTRGVLCLPGGYFGPEQETHLRVAFANVDVAALTSLGARFDGFALER